MRTPRRNPYRRQQDETRRLARIEAGQAPSAAAAPSSGGSVQVGGVDEDTGEFVTFGRWDLTPWSEFRWS